LDELEEAFGAAFEASRGHGLAVSAYALSQALPERGAYAILKKGNPSSHDAGHDRSGGTNAAIVSTYLAGDS
jgi:hypothetical protein